MRNHPAHEAAIRHLRRAHAAIEQLARVHARCVCEVCVDLDGLEWAVRMARVTLECSAVPFGRRPHPHPKGGPPCPGK